MPNITDKIQKIIENCIPCILAEKKQSRQEGFLNTISKGKILLDIYHIDHLGLLPSSRGTVNIYFLLLMHFLSLCGYAQQKPLMRRKY